MNLVKRYSGEGKHIRVYHHYDADGHAAAAVIAGYFLKETRKGFFEFVTDIRFYNTNYNKPMNTAWMDTDEVNDENLIFIVDYSTSRDDDQEVLLEWMEMDNIRVIWIDHHETISTLVEKYPQVAELEGLRITGTKYAGCALTYFFMLEDYWQMSLSDIFGSHSDDIYDEVYKRQMPAWCRYVSDNDTYTNDYEVSTFFAGKMYYDGCWKTCLNYSNQESLMIRFYNFLCYENQIIKRHLNSSIRRPHYYEMECHNPQRIEDTKIDTEWIKFGRMLREIDDNRNSKLVSGAAFEVEVTLDLSKSTIEDMLLLKDVDSSEYMFNRIERTWKGICLNHRGNSYVFGEDFRKYDFVCLYNHNGIDFSYSVFSKEDGGAYCGLLGVIMKAIYGITGGGHRHAAGWSSPDLVFRKDHNVIIKDESSEIMSPHEYDSHKEVTGGGHKIHLYSVKMDKIDNVDDDKIRYAY